MIKGRIIEFLIHPAFISLILWIVIIPFVPNVFSKYRIINLGQEENKIENYKYYFDLNSDGTSESINFIHGDVFRSQVFIKSNH